MIEIVEARPDVRVQPAEYIRLLGYPRGWVLQDRAAELDAWVRAWYARHGTPWLYTRQADHVEATATGVTIDGETFHSIRLSKTFREAGAHGAVLAALGAGAALEEEAQRLWREGKPDEYFFLEVYGSAVVEELVTMAGARWCAWAEPQRMAMLPHYSPGYPEWPIEDQAGLLGLIRRRSETEGVARDGGAPVPVDVLESGMLRPKKSLLAVFGITRHVDRVRPLSDLIPCENCSFGPCPYRRAPYRRTKPPSASEPAAEIAEAKPATRDERLTLHRRPDGTIDAEFRYDGTTCTNMGRPLVFQYRVTLGRRDDGHPILEQACGPAAGDAGHRSMCKYIADAATLMAAIEREQPLHGQPLRRVFDWARPHCPAGCYCDAEARDYKWGLVLETIHFALEGRP